MALTSILPKGNGDPEAHYGARRASVRWPFHTRVLMRHEDAAKDDAHAEIFGVVLNMSAGGFRVAIPKDAEVDDAIDSHENEFETWASTDPGVAMIEEGDCFRTKVEAGDGTVIGTESAEVVWIRNQKDGYLVGLRFISPSSPF